ncbi:zinc finger protein 708-like [Sitophilus oryzae]|uniref:Zinc finger protein 708-like n=1 Tax=Sitophilus oryzae TaxID=7048 RepID=A0A6J2YR54_SITOR|nr:zinc finger protein 708-like [Sitophilus oryzae]
MAWEIADIKKTVNKIHVLLLASSYNIANIGNLPSEQWQLPLADNVSLESFEAFLKEDKNIELLSQRLYLCGGETVHKAIFSIMKKLLAKELAVLYSGSGKKGKLSFKKLNCHAAVIRYFWCNVCHRSYVHRRNWVSHVKFECQKPYRFFCDMCDYKAYRRQSHVVTTFVTPVKGRTRIVAICNDIKTFRCHCGKSYKQVHNLTRHKKYECGQIPKFVCNICGYAGFRNNVLKLHYMTKHKGLSSHFECRNCGKQYRHYKGLRRHISECGQEKKQKFWPFKEQRERVVMDLRCYKCGNTFTRVDNLKRHVKYICGVKPQFKCSYCPYASKHKLEDLDYADDLCIFSHSHSDMSQKLLRLQEEANNVGLQINVAKTKEMRSNTPNNQDLYLSNRAIERVDEFQYLGSMVHSDGGTEKDTEERKGF